MSTTSSAPGPAAARRTSWARTTATPRHRGRLEQHTELPVPLGGGVGVQEEVAGVESREGERVCGHPVARWSGVAPSVGEARGGQHVRQHRRGPVERRDHGSAGGGEDKAAGQTRHFLLLSN